MSEAYQPALIVICGTVPEGPSWSRRAGGVAFGETSVPITWLASPDRLVAVATAMTDSPVCHDFAVQIPASGFESRQRLRSLLARCRETVPALAAVAVDQATASVHRDLLVDEGVRVVLVERLAAAGRGSRRPAPAGWRCRNAAWSLWEVEVEPAKPRGPLARLVGLGMRPRVRRGGLAVLSTEGFGSTGAMHPRLQRLITWAKRLSDRGEAMTVGLSGLMPRLMGEDQAVLAGSVLRAA